VTAPPHGRGAARCVRGLRVPGVDRAIRAGVMGLYRGSPGPLPGTQLGDALILADAATPLLLDGLRPVSRIMRNLPRYRAAGVRSRG
jgi:hypothetical protein